ncbi:RGS domain-containing protein [Cunninghamella echinulata]|nr:RGS domain-containing protein [Cunninghamella echinulata]
MDSPPPCSNFPHTLEQLLHDANSDLFQDFQHYLEQSYCCENLHFWLDVQEYNDICQQILNQLLLEEDNNNNDNSSIKFTFLRSQSDDLPPKQQLLFHVVQKKCHAMIDTYIKPNANQEINIPCELRQELLEQVYMIKNYHPSIFIKLTKSVIELIRVNAFIPWMSSYPLSPHSPCFPNTPSSSTASPPSSGSYSATSTSTSQQQHHQSASLCQTNSSSSTQSSPTSPSFTLDRWYSFSRFRYGRRSCSSLDSNGSIDLLDHDDLDNHHNTSSIKCKNMLQKVKHSFLGPQMTSIKASIPTTATTTTWKKL